MKRELSQPILDRLFRIGITIKGLDGTIEVLGGVFLLLAPTDRLQGKLADIATYEIQSGQHAFIGNTLLAWSQHVDPHVELFAAVYLLGHGLIKLALAAALLQRRWRLYPYAIGFLLAFIAYQLYLLVDRHSVLLGVLTAFDAVVAWLAYQEWRRHQSETAPA